MKTPNSTIGKFCNCVYITIERTYLCIRLHLSVRPSVCPSREVAPRPRVTGWRFEAQRSLDALGMAGLRALGLPLRRASTSSYVGTRRDGKSERHMWKWPHPRSERNRMRGKAPLWRPWRWMATMFWTPVRSETSTIMDAAKLTRFSWWRLTTMPDEVGKISFLWSSCLQREPSSFHDYRSNWEISTFTI